jgi:uncharacterized protein (DUF302 family)
MGYYHAKKVRLSFDAAIEAATLALKAEGFGVLTEIDVTKTLQEKLHVDFRRYRILGACNPPFAHRALQAEDKIGLMLPCNVIVQELPDGTVEVAAIDPIASMAAVGNPALAEVAGEVRDRLIRVIRDGLPG